MKSVNFKLQKLIQVSLILALSIFVTMGCSKRESKNISTNFSLSTAQDKWTQYKNDRNYTLTFHESFFGLSLYAAYRIVVDGNTDQILKAYGITTGDVVVELTNDIQSFQTMDEVFADLENIKASNPDFLEIEYFDYGAVKSYYVDRSYLMADEEHGYTVHSLEF